MTQEWLVVFNLLSIRLQNALSYELPDFGLKCLVTVMPKKISHQNSRLVYEIFPFLKQTVNLILFLDLVIEINYYYGNEKKVEYR